jgi:hypothetical protein
MTMTTKQFLAIGNEMFGIGRWGSKMAEATGLSAGMVSMISNGQPISEKSEEKINAAYQTFKHAGTMPKKRVSILRDEPSNEDETIASHIAKRFAVMNKMGDGVINGDVRSMIVQGPPGIGKTYDLEKRLMNAKRTSGLHVDIIKGSCSGIGLYQALFNAKDGGVVMLDDCDSVFNDEDALNVLKSALDSTETRTVSWRRRSSLVIPAEIYERRQDEAADDEEGTQLELMPDSFDFNGAVVFVTNIDFEEQAAKGTKNSPHFEALMSRSMYLNLAMGEVRHKIIRIKQVFFGGMAKGEGLDQDQANEVMGFVVENQDKFRELSLRLMKHICQAYKIGDDWKDVIRLTKMKG